MRRVGITGAEGHIGSALREGLADRYEIVPFSLMTQAFESTVADLSDVTSTTGIFDGLDAVIHLAADPSPTGSWESMLLNNISATYNVLEEARRAGVKKVVFASTNHTQHGYTMGGSPDELDLEKNFMLRIDDPPNPTSLYGVSKLTGEQLGRFFSREHGLQFVALRIGATGRGDDPTTAVGSPSEDYVRAMFISVRDITGAFVRAIEVDKTFLVAYAVSNNDRRIFDMRSTHEQLGFYPVNNAEDYYPR